jgi:hypothetical protein
MKMHYGESRICGMKPLAAIAGLVLILTLSLLGYSRRAQISAKLWHWRYGHSIDLGNFNIPVPDRWLVKVIDDPRSIILVDTRIRRSTDPVPAVNVIDVNIESQPTPDVDFWAASRRGWLEHHGLESVEARTLQAQAGKIACVGGYELREIVRVPTTSAYSVECRSTMGLNLGFVGNQGDIDEFYSIASNIQKAPMKR